MTYRVSVYDPDTMEDVTYWQGVERVSFLGGFAQFESTTGATVVLSGNILITEED